jgi:endonuclease-3
MRKAFLFLRSEKARDRQPPSMGDQKQPFDPKLLVDDFVQSHPKRIKRPFANATAMAHLPESEFGRGDGDLLIGFRTFVADLERHVEEQDIKAKKTEYRPSPSEQEDHPSDEADTGEEDHHPSETLASERTVRCEHGRKNCGFARGLVVASHDAHYTKTMPRKTSSRRRSSSTRAAGPVGRAPQALRQARAGKAARLKPPGNRAVADRRAAEGALPEWTNAEIEEAFRRFAAANPQPKGELKHIDPFTLLVAVVLSAQATDAGVNKATPALFAVADSPANMLALGEARLQEFIKTIGLFRTKAKNLIALSRKLVEEHDGEVPRDREALEALPGVGRKTANVVLNVAFGEPTIAVDTHIFRVGNRTGLATGKTPLEVEMKLENNVPAKYKRHAHHWLILHGRYVCVARRPLCEKCLIADLCKWPGKTASP